MRLFDRSTERFEVRRDIGMLLGRMQRTGVYCRTGSLLGVCERLRARRVSVPPAR